MSAELTPSTLNIPAVPGKYRAIFELGRGGMADVVLAVIQGPGGFNKLQVLKRLRSELAADPEFLTMFLDEARLSARINHPNVVQTNEVGHDGKHYFLAMEYLEGQSLESFMRRAATRGNGLPLSMCLQIVIDSLAGLQHAHDLADFDGTPLNVVHRDISPQNIFVTYDGQTKILDFGIAKASDSSSETRVGVVKGKVAYMAPEQLRGGKGIDRRADVFSSGAVLWRAIAGRRLWKGLSDIEIFQNLARGEIPSPTTIVPDAPPRLVEICMKALAVRPSDRYSSAFELQTDLEDYLSASSEKVSHREIGRLLTDLFADHRSEVRNAVEARLRATTSPPREGSEVPALFDIPNTLSTDVLSSSSDSLQDMPQPRNSMPVALPPPQRSLSSASFTQPSFAVKTRSTNRSLVVGVLLGAAVGLVVAVVAATLLYARASTVPPTPAPSSITAVAAPSELTELIVQVTPSTARVYVDDEPLKFPPQYVRDGAKHWVHAEAPGFMLKATLVPFELPTQTVEITLEGAIAAPTSPK